MAGAEGTSGRRSQMEAELRAPVRNLLSSGLLDLEWYAALRGRQFHHHGAAAEDFIAWAMPQELPPHPLLDLRSAPPHARRAWRNGRPKPYLTYLADCDGGAVSPLLRADAVRPAGSLRDYLDRLTDDAVLPRPDTALPHSVTAGSVRRHLMAAAHTLRSEAAAAPPTPVDWDALEQSLLARVPGRTSVVIPTYDDAWMTTRAVRRLLQHSLNDDIEIVVIDNGSSRATALSLVASLHGAPCVRLVRSASNLGFARGSNLGAAHTTGDVIVFLNNDTEVRAGWLRPLRDALGDPSVAGAQPLLLYPDDQIQAAGTVFLDGDLLPCHLLTGHPPEDAAGVGEEQFAAVTAATLALRANDVVRHRGFDEGYRNGFEDVDLCLRIGPETGRHFRVCPDSVVTHHESKTSGRYTHAMENRRQFLQRWNGQLPTPDAAIYERLGFHLERVDADGQEVPAAKPVVTRGPRQPGRLRWSLKLASTGGQWGDTWGDTYFARDLAAALRAQGEEVVTARYGAHAGGPTHLDDVSLFLRGLHPAVPVPGTTNVLWVISHPDRIDPEELEGFDLVFAASESWARTMSTRAGRKVQLLRQATAIRPGAIAAPYPDSVTRAVFVGSNGDHRERPLIHDVLAAGIEVDVFGHGWDGLLPNGAWKRRHVPPEEVPELYRSYGLVLADHWPAMAAHGFVANRVYDAVAAGAFVVSDEVSGIEEFLPGSVKTWSRRLARKLRRGRIPTSEERHRAAQRIALQHSFEARAQTLIQAARGVIEEG